MKCLLELDSERFGLTWPEKIAYLAHRFMQAGDVKCPVTHIFEPGMYIREMFIPKGTFFVGRAHRYGHRCELVSGKVLLVTEHAKRHIEAPFEIFTEPCYQMVLMAVEDTVGRTYHPNPAEDRDLQKLEDDAFRPGEEIRLIGQAVAERIRLLELEAA